MRLTLVLVVAACTPANSSSPSANGSNAPPHAESNIARADYVGPRVCGDCHADEYARWSQSLHRVMNARASDADAIVGDFDDAVVHYAGGEAHFTHDAGGYAIAVRKAAREVRYRVTRTIGRRGLQEYVGIEDGHTDEVRLPFGVVARRRGGWYPQPYFDPWLGDEASFDAFAPVREPWAERCPWCHSTYPFEQRIERSSGPARLGHGLESSCSREPRGPPGSPSTSRSRPGSAARAATSVAGSTRPAARSTSCRRARRRSQPCRSSRLPTSAVTPPWSTRCARSVTRDRRRGSRIIRRCATRARRSISARRRAPGSSAPIATMRIAPIATSTRDRSRRARTVTRRSAIRWPHARTRGRVTRPRAASIATCRAS